MPEPVVKVGGPEIQDSLAWRCFVRACVEVSFQGQLGLKKHPTGMWLNIEELGQTAGLSLSIYPRCHFDSIFGATATDPSIPQWNRIHACLFGRTQMKRAIVPRIIAYLSLPFKSFDSVVFLSFFPALCRGV